MQVQHQSEIELEKQFKKYETISNLFHEWERLPDWRLGQLIINFIGWYGDIFYLTEEDFIKQLNKYINMCKGE